MGRSATIDQLITRLSSNNAAFDPLYLISGDEPLLVTEAADGLRAAARQAGYTERITLVLDARSDWTELDASTRNISLFGDRRLVELRLPTGKPGKTGAEALQALAANASKQTADDTTVVVTLPRLDKTTRHSKWADALWQAATTIELPNITRQDLPGWIGQRLARQQQSADPETLSWIADRVEGNLLAAHQEIMKLGLLYPEGSLQAEAVQQAVLNVARYDLFGLRDAMLAGDAQRTLTILAGLQAEGEALPLVLWAVGEEVRILARLAQARSHGHNLSGLMRENRIFGSREHLVRQTLDRHPAAVWPVAVQQAHDIDRLIKGLKVPGRLDDPWDELARLALRIALSPKPPKRTH